MDEHLLRALVQVIMKAHAENRALRVMLKIPAEDFAAAFDENWRDLRPMLVERCLAEIRQLAEENRRKAQGM